MTLGSFSLDFLTAPTKFTTLDFIGLAFVILYLAMVWSRHINSSMLGD